MGLLDKKSDLPHPEALPDEEDPRSPNYDPEAVRLNGALRALRKLNAERGISRKNGKPIK
jgi:hypothetical protein